MTVNLYNGYHSNYWIQIFDQSFFADTIDRSSNIEEQKYYSAGKCKWRSESNDCAPCGVGAYPCAIREIDEDLRQKVANGLSALWGANNIAYFYEERNRSKCLADALQDGTLRRVCGDTDAYTYWGGPNKEDFGNCKWSDVARCLPLSECPDGLGKCFRLSMPGDDWVQASEDYIEFEGSSYHGDHYRWVKKTDDIDTYKTVPIRKFKIDGGIEFDATKTYKTYYLDDRATENTQGLIIAGKGINEGNEWWEVYHERIDENNLVVRDNITEELFKKLKCNPGQLIEIGLI